MKKLYSYLIKNPKIIIISIFFLINVSPIFTEFREPVPPEEPKIEEPEKTVPDKTVKTQSRKPIKVYSYDVTLIFSNKLTLSGIISFLEDNVAKVKHYKNGFLFRKTIKWEDVKRLEINEWKAEYSGSKIKSNTLLYYFYPYKFQFIMKDKSKYTYEGHIKYLDKLILSNAGGSTEVYSYFADYWIVINQKSGYWKNIKKYSFEYPFKNPNPHVIRAIDFK